MKQTKTILIICTLMIMLIGSIGAQNNVTYYYNDKDMGVGTKSECATYKVFKTDNQGVPVGEIRKYYNTGELMAIAESAKSIDRFNDANSIYCGQIKIYYKSGKLQEKCFRDANGKLVGEDVCYYESGKVQMKAIFDSNSEAIGTVKYYYENGKLSQEFEYSNGAFNGKGYYYSESGNKTAEMEFENGKPKYDWYLAFDESGQSYKYNVETNQPYNSNNNKESTTNSNKEIKSFFKDGKAYQYYVHNGISVTMHLSIEKNYGKYYIAYIAIENLTGKQFNFNPNTISAVFLKGGENSNGEVLSHSEYMRKVSNRQAWNAALVAFGESSAASQAGYSSSSTTTTTSGYYNSYGSVSGYYGDTYGSAYGSSTTYGTATTNSTTQSYNGAANYAAQQNAQKNIANYQNQQYQIKDVLNQGYLKLNTIGNEQRIVGYVNVKFKKADKVKITIPVNGVNYDFWWNNQ